MVLDARHTLIMTVRTPPLSIAILRKRVPCYSLRRGLSTLTVDVELSTWSSVHGGKENINENDTNACLREGVRLLSLASNIDCALAGAELDRALK